MTPRAPAREGSVNSVDGGRGGLQVASPTDDSGVMGYGAGISPIGLVHRGGGALAPENTLAAFASSVGLGYRHLESDVRLTADGRLVLFHDATLDLSLIHI